MAKAKKQTKATDEQTETESTDSREKTPEGFKLLSWSLAKAEPVKFLVKRPQTLADLLDPNFGGRSAPMASSERAIVDKYFGQWTVEERREAIDAGHFGTEEEPKTPTVEAIQAFVNSTTIGESRGRKTGAPKVRKVKAEELKGLSKDERLARLEAMFVDQE